MGWNHQLVMILQILLAFQTLVPARLNNHAHLGGPHPMSFLSKDLLGEVFLGAETNTKHLQQKRPAVRGFPSRKLLRCWKIDSWCLGVRRCVHYSQWRRKLMAAIRKDTGDTLSPTIVEVENYRKETTIGGTQFSLPWLWEEVYPFNFPWASIRRGYNTNLPRSMYKKNTQRWH